MEPLEVALLTHRRALYKYMEEWSKLQESILFKYACTTAAGTHDAPVRPSQKMTPIPDHGGASSLDRAARHEADALIAEGISPPAPAKAGSWEGLGNASASEAVPSQGLETSVEGHGHALAAASRLRTSVEPVVQDTQQVPPEAAGIQRSKEPSENSGLDGIKAMVSCRSDQKQQEISPVPGHSVGGRLEHVLESHAFGFWISSIIISNVLFMAIAADHTLESARRGHFETQAYVLVPEICFTVIYVIELTVKLFCYRRRFFCGVEHGWNIFDMVIVLSAVVDLIAALFVGEAINLSFLRVNRLLKLVKMMRVVTVYRAFKQLRLIIASMLGCVKTMFWAIALLGTVLFTFSLLFVQAATDYVQAVDQDAWNPEILQYWGSTPRAMLTLFESSTGGEDWSKVAYPLMELGWVYYAAFLLYICFFMFVVVNMLTALFVDAALDHSMKDDSMVIREELQHREEYIQQIRALYRRLDLDGSGDLSWEEFSKGLQSPDMIAFAASLDIEVSDIHEFFRLISSEGRDVVDIDSFVVGCIKLKGAARSLDAVSLIHRTRHLQDEMSQLSSGTDRQLQEIRHMLTHILYEREREKAKELVWPPPSKGAAGPGNFMKSEWISIAV